MGFKYINEIATSENINQLLTLIDRVAGASSDVNNVFDVTDMLRDSPQMEQCLKWGKAKEATISAKWLKSSHAENCSHRK